MSQTNMPPVPEVIAPRCEDRTAPITQTNQISSHPMSATVKSPPKIGLLDHVGYGNMGDDATLAAVMHNIRCRWPQALIVGLTLNPHDTQKRHGITSYPIRRDCKLPPPPPPSKCGRASFEDRIKAKLSNYPVLKLVLRAVKAVTLRAPRAIVQELLFLAESIRVVRSLDLLIVSGGGQLRDAWKGPWKFPYTLFKWVVLAKLSGARCYFINVGAGPLKTRPGRFFIKQALRLADYVSFRDKRSEQLIRGIGFTKSSRVHADCVYALPIPANGEARHTPASQGSLIGISPILFYWNNDPRSYTYLIHELGRFSTKLARAQYRLQFFATDIWSDYEAVTDLHAEMIKEFAAWETPRVAYPHIDGINDLLRQMSSMDYIVTCRFHGLIFAHLLNIPVLAISHHPKMATLMNDLGLSEYWVDIRKFDSDLLADTFARLVENRVEIKARMAEKAACFRRELKIQFDQLFPQNAAAEAKK
jgi:polysaccharide pyruvyl transferase WcaK-like protein